MPGYQSRIDQWLHSIDKPGVTWTLAIVGTACIATAAILTLRSMYVASQPDLTSLCAQFETWNDANDYWLDDLLGTGGALNMLDTNGNMIPCEALADNPRALLQRSDLYFVCDDFDYREQAQWWFDTWVSDHPELRSIDGDRNGIACQGLPTVTDGTSAIALRLNRLREEGLR